jgi:uncharacterized caspase-like protein
VILIANSAYTNLQPLSAPPHDVEALSSQLSQLGFATTILQNPSYHDVIEAIETASQGASRGSLLALYYSGHAARVEGENSLLLAGFRWDGSKNNNQRIPLQVVLPLLAAANFEKVFVAFDACRNPVGNEGAKSAQEGKDSILPDRIRGLARTDSDFEELARKEYAVLFSTSQGAYAYDTTVDGLSPFTKAFSLALAKETSFLKAMVLTKQITVGTFLSRCSS